MTIDEAIKILYGGVIPADLTQVETVHKAIKLGIEALKLEKARRSIGSSVYQDRLPGETEE